MELDQLLFVKAWRFCKNLNKKGNPEEDARTVKLEEIKPRLTLFARALTGAAIDIYTAENEGGWKDDVFLLPEKYAKGNTMDENLAFYLFRTAYLSVQKKLDLNWERGAEKSLEESRKAALDSAPEVLNLLFKEYPVYKGLYNEIRKNEEKYFEEKDLVPDLFMLFGRWMINQNVAAGSNSIKNANSKGSGMHNDEITTELKAKPVDEVKTIEIDRQKIEDYVLTHNFEKVETADEFDGVWRETDGDDTLAEDQEALDELSLKHTIRVDDPVHSVYQAEFAGNSTQREAAEVEEEGKIYQYDEWDFAKRKYKPEFCKVLHKKLIGGSDQAAYDLINSNKRVHNRLQKMLADLYNRFEQVNRQKDGEDIDFDAFCDALADIKSGGSASDKFYLSKRKRKKDVGVVILMDQSLSTDSYTEGRRVLDVEKASVLLLGEALNILGIEFRVDAFNSRTRNHCMYNTLKDFKDPWVASRGRIAAVSPEGYTRIGPALRHSGALLEDGEWQKKWIIMFSDGKPNDYDKYEGKYGIEDVKKALTELNQKNIHTYALAVESKARFYLPQMFGYNCYNILPDPILLPEALNRFIMKVF